MRVKALLDSGATGLFANRKFVEKHGFKMQKLDRPVNVRNVDGIKNSKCKGKPSKIQRSSQKSLRVISEKL